MRATQAMRHGGVLARVRAFYASAVGRKVAMAISGFVVVGWLLLHMLGNVAIFAGPAKYNAYAALLAAPALLWTQRVILLCAIAVHVHAAVTLWRQNSAARPRAYRSRANLASDHASRSMRYGGVALVAFLVFHLVQLTVGVTGFLGYTFVRGDVYNNAVLGFTVPWVAAFYLLAQVALGLHLYHGVWSMTQTLGLSHPTLHGARRALSIAVTLAITLGLSSIPIAVQLGWLRPT
ncbi:MAG: succinate dehydrogenase cytochrome b subunit [Polyangiales bacterium]